MIKSSDCAKLLGVKFGSKFSLINILQICVEELAERTRTS